MRLLVDGTSQTRTESSVKILKNTCGHRPSGTDDHRLTTQGRIMLLHFACVLPPQHVVSSVQKDSQSFVEPRIRAWSISKAGSFFQLHWWLLTCRWDLPVPRLESSKWSPYGRVVSCPQCMSKKAFNDSMELTMSLFQSKSTWEQTRRASSSSQKNSSIFLEMLEERDYWHPLVSVEMSKTASPHYNPCTTW